MYRRYSSQSFSRSSGSFSAIAASRSCRATMSSSDPSPISEGTCDETPPPGPEPPPTEPAESPPSSPVAPDPPSSASPGWPGDPPEAEPEADPPPDGGPPAPPRAAASAARRWSSSRILWSNSAVDEPSWPSRAAADSSPEAATPAGGFSPLRKMHQEIDQPAWAFDSSGNNGAA